ncbi:alpha/beta hydrolase [Fulvivirga sp. RKSG066]|nr:alpha/beta hydrolase [Fulvivirga aurantia]
MTQAQPQTIAEIIKPYSFDTKYAVLRDSIKLAYIDEGAGDKTLVFIHGLATYLPSWYKNIPALSKKYRCIAIDLPGYGRSSKGKYPGTMSFYASIVNELIEKLALENIVLVGHSMGAQVSLTTALKYPEKIESLIVASPAGFERFNENESVWLKSVFKAPIIASATPEQIRANYGLNFYQMPADIDFMIEDRINMAQAEDFMDYCNAVAKGVIGMLDEPVFDDLSEIDQPVLVVYGANDALIPNQLLHKNITTKQVAEASTEKLPNASLHIIPECGHFVPFEKADIFNNLIVEFLSK